MNISLQGPLLERVKAVRDTFAFLDEADTLRFLIRVGITEVTPKLIASQTVTKLGPFMEGQFALAIKENARGGPADESPP